MTFLTQKCRSDIEIIVFLRVDSYVATNRNSGKRSEVQFKKNGEGDNSVVMKTSYYCLDDADADCVPPMPFYPFSICFLFVYPVNLVL